MQEDGKGLEPLASPRLSLLGGRGHEVALLWLQCIQSQHAFLFVSVS